jgi:hypothetical protein
VQKCAVLGNGSPLSSSLASDEEDGRFHYPCIRVGAIMLALGLLCPRQK